MYESNLNETFHNGPILRQLHFDPQNPCLMDVPEVLSKIEGGILKQNLPQMKSDRLFLVSWLWQNITHEIVKFLFKIHHAI